MMASLRNRRAHDAVQSIPRGDDLLVGEPLDHIASFIQSDPLPDGDSQILQLSAAPLERLDQIGMGYDAGAASAELDVAAFVDIGPPASLSKKRGGEEARHRAADHNRTALVRRSIGGRH